MVRNKLLLFISILGLIIEGKIRGLTSFSVFCRLKFIFYENQGRRQIFTCHVINEFNMIS